LNDLELSEEIRALIYSSVPDLDALELLIFLACQTPRVWTAETLGDAIRPIKESALRQYLALFQEQELVQTPSPGDVVFKPANAALAAAVAGLCRAYNERPVTLIRTVYSIADSRKIQAFADAFKLKKKP
jgi:hypothetical protein